MRTSLSTKRSFSKLKELYGVTLLFEVLNLNLKFEKFLQCRVNNLEDTWLGPRLWSLIYSDWRCEVSYFVSKVFSGTNNQEKTIQINV